jgi:hypothetical protein
MKLLGDETVKIATEVVELSASMPRQRVARISLPPSSFAVLQGRKVKGT